MPTKVIIISDTDLEKEYQRALDRLREQWRMEHPRWAWNGGVEISPDQHVSTNAEKQGKSESRKVY